MNYTSVLLPVHYFDAVRSKRIAMPVEIEAKMTLSDPRGLRDALRRCGAELLGECLEINSFFDTEDRALLAADEGLRLRTSRDLDSGQARTTLTHKGPRSLGPLKNRQETEITVGDADEAWRLLQCLGFGHVLSFQKRRQSWKMGDCKVDLDELPHLGRFVEIEGPSEQAVFQARETLGLAQAPVIKASYIALLLTHLQERGESRTEILFSEGGEPARMDNPGGAEARA